MKTISRYIMTLVALLAVTTGAWAQAPTIYFQQDYTTETVDWSTGTAGRYTPIVENGYLTVTQNQRQNNGTTLTCTATQGKVDAGKDFTMTFNVKLGASTQQTATAFNIYDAANSAPILSFAEGSAGATAWKINGGTQTATVSAGGGKSLNELSWIFIQVTSIAGGKTYLTLKDDQNNIIDGFDKTEIPTLSVAGGLGKMTFVTSRYSANFAIDNVLVCDVEPEITEWSLTPDADKKVWTLAEMPASNVELQVEYYAESNLFLGKEALADKTNIAVTAGELGVQFGDDGKSTTTVTEGNTVTAKFTGTKKVLGMKAAKKSLLSIQITGPTEATIYYFEGETWEQAIQNHPEENSAWSIDQGHISSNGYYLYAGGNLVNSNDTIAPNAGYRFPLS